MSEKESVRGARPVLTDSRIMAILMAILLISIGTIGYLVATSTSIQSEPLPIVEAGDVVYIDYVGYFSSNPGGWVFDTSDRLVAFDESVPKSLFFVQREPNEYRQLNFTAGSEGANLLDPFIDGVIGMMVTEKKLLKIPAEDAYPVDLEQIIAIPINQTVQVLETISVAEFFNRYELTPKIGLVVQHYFWEWNIRVRNVSGDLVTYQNEPMKYQIISSFGNPAEDPRDGWYQQVLSVDPTADGGLGKIVVNNMVSSQDVYQKKGVDMDGRFFTLLAVDEGSDKFTIHYNAPPAYIGEIAGRTLFFEITLNRVLKG